MLKLTALKKKNILLLIPLAISLIGAFIYYFSCVKLKPNDVIITTSDGTALFSNENPTFKVDFGSKENPQGQMIRFEAEASKTNPFEVEEKKSIFTKIAELFKPEKKLGIQMSLVGIDFSETEKSSDVTLANNLQTVAEILGTDKVETTTNLIDMGREIGEYDTEETVSKQTVVNSNVVNGIDLEYQILSGLGLKEEIVINDLEAYSNSCGENCSLPLNKFEFDISVDDGVVLKKGWFTLEGQSTEIYYFVDGEGNYLAHFLPSYAIDAAGEKTYEVNLNAQEYSTGKFKAVVTVDSSWLLDSDRVYPIRIDPSIVHDDTTDFSGGIFNRIESVTGPKIQVAAGFSCTGGTESTVNGYKLHTFTTSGTLTCTGGGNAEVLVVAGGGGGGNGSTTNGGGGGGGLVYNSNLQVAGGNTTVTVGNGGSAGTNGGNSSFSTITAYGGGAGGASSNGSSGGCGGGGGAWNTPAYYGGAGTQGYGGGDAVGAGGRVYAGGGGGGMGARGGDVPSSEPKQGGVGGNGLAYSISGTSAYYSGGGGGGSRLSVTVSGGLGGGGTGGGNGTSATAGTANTGGGGGGSYAGGMAGGSGIVMIKYLPGLPSPWGEYISSILNFGSSMSGATLSWLASGIATGNGETPYSTTGLVAQWNFNETSGTTAVSGGTCGTSCNGTLTNMTTTGQDAAFGTGWTANNRRWGAGALMFDGSNDHVSVTQNANINNMTTKTVCTWVNLRTQVGTDSTGSHIINKGDLWFIATDPANSRNIFGQNFSTTSGRWSFPLMEVGKWNHLCVVYDRSSVSNDPAIYVNGVSQTVTEYSTPVGTASDDASSNLILGASLANGRWLAGQLDSTTIYSRALSATEILSNYQTGNIEFQYRVSTNGSTWGDWTAYNDGALVFDGMDDYVNVGDNANIDVLTEFSICTWVKPDSVTDDDFILGKVNNSTWSGMMLLRDDVGQVSGRTDMYKIWVGQNNTYASIEGATNSSVLGVWTHVCATFKANDASGLHLYVNGTEDANSPVSTVGITNIDSGTSNLTIGRYDPGAGSYFVGAMDNIQLYNRALTSSEVSYNYGMTGSETPYNSNGLIAFWKFNESSGTTAANSGSGIAFNGTLTNFSSTSGRDSLSYTGWSSKSKRGSDVSWNSFDNANLYGFSDLGLVAYWSLDESSGSGAYLTDKSTYAPFATGGTITYSGGYTIHTFTAGGTLTVNNSGNIDILVVAGGGGGGGSGGAGGGGGGGGVVYQTGTAVSDQGYTVTVGSGGNGSSSSGGTASQGGDSSFGTLASAVGGGGGGGYNGSSTTAPTSGGSGGGGGSSASGSFAGASGTSGQGSAGGDGLQTSTIGSQSGGGGGGASVAGGNGSSSVGGNGGNGLSNSISGSAVVYGGGGAGGKRSTGTAGTPGTGGGGTSTVGSAGGAGTDGLGGGGGAGSNGNSGGNGGSGVVIVRYPSYYVGTTSSEDLTPTGTTYVAGKHSGARSFNGSSDYLSCTDANCGGSGKLDAMGGSLSIETWVKPTTCSTVSVSPAIVDKFDTSTSKGYLLYNEYYSGANVWTFYDPVNNSYARSTTACTTGVWTHIVAVYDASGASKKIYINGALEATLTSQVALGDSTSDFNIGRYRNSGYYYNGLIDEVKIYNTALSASTIQADYIQGISSSGSAYQQKASDGVIKQSGTDANRITNSLNNGLVSYWNLNEASGTSLIDSVSANNATASSTTVVAGKYGNARGFTSSNITAPTASAYETSSFTWEAWINPNWTASSKGYSPLIVGLRNANSTTRLSAHMLDAHTGIIYWNGTGNVTHSYTFSNSTWYLITIVYSGGNVSTYVNGLNIGTSAYALGSGTNQPFTIGSRTDSAEYFTGSIDEVKIYNVAKTTDEILEEYNATSIYYANYNLSSTDLSNKNTLSMSFAGDKIGSYASATWGESAYANYQTDTNTVGLWHLDEISGSGAYIKDSSGRNNSGTPTGTTIAQGKLGNSRYIGGSNYISVPDSNNLDISDNLSIDAWLYPTAEYTGYAVHPINKGDAATTSDNFVLYYFGTTGTNRSVRFYATAGGTWKAISGEYILSLNNWYHVALTYSSVNGGQLYINGQSVGVPTGSGTLSVNNQPLKIGGAFGGNASFPGNIDEVRISNSIRTADQIRQAYEIGLRTHNITVDFGATLSSGNLITSSSDTSFTVDATTQGLSQMGSNLYAGDKIVVREISSGTEYIAQGTVSAITTATGATTVTSWDTNSTFPSGGFTTKASVFKWQTEYIPIKNRTIATQVDATSLLTLRFTGAFGGRNMWIDNLRTSTGYINNSAGDLVTFPSSGGYLQYKAIMTSQNQTVTPYLSQLQLDYSAGGPSMDQIMRHGKWFDSGNKKNFWWANSQ